jgi:hypothetical protein
VCGQLHWSTLLKHICVRIKVAMEAKSAVRQIESWCNVAPAKPQRTPATQHRPSRQLTMHPISSSSGRYTAHLYDHCEVSVLLQVALC